MRKLLFTVALVAGCFAIQAQSFIDNAKVSGSFQVDGQFYAADDGIGITDSMVESKKLGMAGFGKLQYTLGNFAAGMRFEAYMPELNGFRSELAGSGIANYWATYDNGYFGFTVGDIYDQFGNGLIFRTYEEWTLGYDNALRGARAIVRPIPGVTIKGVYGRQRYYWASYLDRDMNDNDLRGIVRGIDGDWDLAGSIPGFGAGGVRASVGASFVSKYQEDKSLFYNIPENVGAFAGRLNFGWGGINFNTEYAYKINDPSAINNFIYKEGQALLASLSYAQKGFGVVLQVKRVDNMSFKSMYTAKENDLDINFIPPINYTHTHSLTSLYTYSTQPNGEMAAQFQVNYTIPKKTALGGKYGTKLTFNYSQVNDIKRDPVEDDGEMLVGEAGTLGYKSPFFGISDHIFFRDFNFEIERRLSKKWNVIAQYVNLLYDMETIEGHVGVPDVRANIVFADVSYKITSKQSIRLELQHLWDNIGKDYEVEAGGEKDFIKRGNWFSALVEYSIAPKWFVSIADKYNYGNPVSDYRDHYFTGSIGYIKDATRIAISGGRQSEGVVCVGGVCRTVPASSGVSISITTSF